MPFWSLQFFPKNKPKTHPIVIKMNLFFIFGNNSRLDNLLLKLTDLWNIRIEVQSHNEFGPTVFSLSANRVLFSNTWGRLGHMRRKKMLTHALYCLAFAESSLLSLRH